MSHKKPAFDFEKCMRGEGAPDSDQRKCHGWTILDNIEYMKSKISLHDRYTKFYRQKFNKTIEANNDILEDANKDNLKIRKRRNNAMNPDARIIATVFRKDKSKKLAFKGMGCDRAVWMMDQTYGQLRHQLDSLRCLRKQRENKFKHTLIEVEKMAFESANTRVIGWEKAFKKSILAQENEMQHVRQRYDTSWFLYQQLCTIRNSLYNDIIRADSVLATMSKTVRRQMVDLKEIKEIFEDSGYTREEIKHDLINLEGLIYQNAYAQEKQITVLQQEYTQIKSERLEKQNETSILGLEEPVESAYKWQESMQYLEELIDMYEAVFEELKEMSDAKNVDEVELSIMTQYILMKELIDIKNKLKERLDYLKKKRIALQQFFLENQDRIEWKELHCEQTVKDCETDIREEHCRGYECQNYVNRVCTVVIRSKSGLNRVIQVLNRAENNQVFEDADQTEKSVAELMGECKEKLSALVDFIKSGNYGPYTDMTYKEYLIEAQFINPEINMRVAFPKGSENALKRMILFDEEDNDETPTREYIKAISHELAESSRKLILQKKQAGMF